MIDDALWFHGYPIQCCFHVVFVCEVLELQCKILSFATIIAFSVVELVWSCVGPSFESFFFAISKLVTRSCE